MHLRKKLVVATAVTASLALGGAAYAYWTSSGSGGGTGTTATPEGVTITGNLAAGTVLFPGVVDVELPITLTNTNPFAVKLGPIGATVKVNGDTVNGQIEDLTELCAITVAPLTVNTSVGAATAQPATATTTLLVSMANTDLDQSRCQGRLVNFTYTAAPPLP